ncbi:sodium/proton antiporter, CPA1 family [Lutibacter agarilyticus]|uniref:Sodium/proton antiporter, CPA1 family n=1 Tax=Lutibacter agarilyticus TaxID=1109740 RepID=A0A238XBN9_9FLAO|nr:sodium:proton antiporter [Lutibacter agarilyticus]SNR55953.1 sodium/proton antiporter, CPA1 family [Lutibacter agarilyticus]
MLEFAAIIILGVIAYWVAWKFKIPAILPLILIGLLVGPISTFITKDGTQWIQPVWNGEEGLFPGERLFNFVSLAISIILFEGGLTLKKNEVLNVGPVIGKLITLGSAVTFFGGAVAAHYIFNLSWDISFLFSALIIVTGPTVIGPILRNIPLKKDVSAVLKWEGILIDPIGALVSVLVFEFISVGYGYDYTKEALLEFMKIVIIGLSIGFTAAYALYYSLRFNIIPHYLLNVITLASVLFVFVLADLFAHESGLLAVVVMGMVLGNMKVAELKEILYFKESLSILLISILFILLSANISVDDLLLLYKWETLILFSVVVFVLRPVGVFLSTAGSSLKFNEKLFISWVGPRGIVAAGIASLFGLKLEMQGEPGAEYITPMVFMIVLGTVLLNATTARLFSKMVGVFLKSSDGIMIIGASNFSRLIAKYLTKNGRRVVLIDNNAKHIEKAKSLDLEAIQADIYADELTRNIELNDIGYLLALTGGGAVNEYAIKKFAPIFGEKGAFRIITTEELVEGKTTQAENLFTNKDDFLNLGEIVRDFPLVNEVIVSSNEHYLKLMDEIYEEPQASPMFLKDNSGVIHIISSLKENFKIEKGNVLIYVGKTII